MGKNDISLPPNEETTLEEVFSTIDILNGINIDRPNDSSELKIFQLFSHAHQLMTRFDILILKENGEQELIYTAAGLRTSSNIRARSTINHNRRPKHYISCNLLQ